MSPSRRGSSGYRGVRERPAAPTTPRSGPATSGSASAQNVALRLVLSRTRTVRSTVGGSADERAMAEWRRRHPEDVWAENASWAERTAKRRAERLERRRRKALAISQCDIVEVGGVSIFGDNDPRWEDMWIDTSDNTSPDEDDSE
nr:uncharacterized protein LOC109756651 [Aegilops tauschii subsp. strangulata]